jgi:hypothetical protein
MERDQGKKGMARSKSAECKDINKYSTLKPKRIFSVIFSQNYIPSKH